MTITNGYCTLADFKAFARITDTVDDTINEAVINAASRMVDRYTGRRFWQDATVVTREFHADDAWCVQVDDVSTLTGLIVKTDEADAGTFTRTLTITTDYMCYPLNAADETPARPFDEIRIMSSSSYLFPTTARPGVQVTAKFGWAAVPDEVKVATIFQAEMLYAAKDARSGIVQAAVDGYATRMSRYLHPQAELLLADFVKVAR